MRGILKSRYGYLWVTLIFFTLSLIAHWVFAWFAYLHEQADLGAVASVSGYVMQTARDTFENWQSEFLQLIWQVAGLAYLLYIGSPQSKEGDERKEEKLDAILKAVEPQQAQTLIMALDKKYPRA